MVLAVLVVLAVLAFLVNLVSLERLVLLARLAFLLPSSSTPPAPPTQPPTQNSKLKTQNSSTQPSGCLEAISLPLIADINDRPRQRVDMEHGKPALTLYNIVEVRAVDANTAVAYTTKKVDKGRTLVHLYPKTGRTHQLRVHCAHPLGLACPILGDPLYGTERADRMYLHAAELTFRHPVTGETMHFLSPSGF